MSLITSVARRAGVLLLSAASMIASHAASAQTFGVELHNTVMPASGAMAAAGINIALVRAEMNALSAS